MPHAGYSKRITALVRDIWSLQLRLSRRQGKRAHKLMEQPKFRAAFDLLVLRAQAENNNEPQRLTQWWDEFQNAPLTRQKSMANERGDDGVRRRPRRRRRRAPRREGSSE